MTSKALLHVNESLEQKVAETTCEQETALARLQLTNLSVNKLVKRVPDNTLYMLDPTGHVGTWNTGKTPIKGYSTTEIIFNTFIVLYTDEDQVKGIPAVALEVAERLSTDHCEAVSVVHSDANSYHRCGSHTDT